MQFRSLTIERVTYGERKGQIDATLMVDGSTADITIRLAERVATHILNACAAEVASAASEQALAFREEFLSAINHRQQIAEGK